MTSGAAPGPQLSVVTEETFDAETSSGVVLIDFYADWCQPCHVQKPILQELAVEEATRLSVKMVDVKAQPGLAARFHVSTVPMLLLMKDGKVARRLSGVRRKRQLVEELNELATEA